MITTYSTKEKDEQQWQPFVQINKDKEKAYRLVKLEMKGSYYNNSEGSSENHETHVKNYIPPGSGGTHL